MIFGNKFLVEETQPIKPVEKSTPTNNNSSTTQSNNEKKDDSTGDFAKDLQDSINKIKGDDK